MNKFVHIIILQHFQLLLYQTYYKTEREVKTVKSFRWVVASARDTQVLASPRFGFDRNQFICFLSKLDASIYLAKVTGSAPITVKAR